MNRDAARVAVAQMYDTWRPPESVVKLIETGDADKLLVQATKAMGHVAARIGSEDPGGWDAIRWVEYAVCCLVDSFRYPENEARLVHLCLAGVERARQELGCAEVGVHRPVSHYLLPDGREVLDVIFDFFDRKYGERAGIAKEAACLFCAMKYDGRNGRKAGAEAADDDRKARFYYKMAAHVRGEGPDPRLYRDEEKTDGE